MTTHRGIRLLLAWALTALALAATPAWSAEIVDVRVGRHPDFTRVVFELDSPTGYRIERHADATPGEDSIVVTLEARSAARSISKRTGVVESVALEEQLGRAVAQIHISKSKLPLKEMILANPPRIVLDLMTPAPERTAVAAKPRPAAKPALVEPVVPVEPAPEVVAEIPPEPEPVAKPIVPVPAAKPVVEVVEPTPPAIPEPAIIEPEPVVAIAEPAVDPEPDMADSETPDEPSAEPDSAPASGWMPGNTVADVPEPIAPKPAPTRIAPRLPPAPLAPESDSILPVDPMTAAGLAGLVLLVVGGGVAVMRRRSSNAALDQEGPTEEDDFASLSSEIANDAMSAGTPAADSAEGLFDGDTAAMSPGDSESDLPALHDDGMANDPDADLPVFSGFDADPNAAPADEPALRDSDGATAPAVRTATDSTPVAGPASGGLFDEDDEKGDDDMEQMASMTGSEQPTMASFAAGGDADVARLVTDLETRLAQVEARLEETTQTCDRLERQVAAQSEELRVQRAAIARTQRALRSLSRTEEEQATEPALRES